jgi:hypothetical protein
MLMDAVVVSPALMSTPLHSEMMLPTVTEHHR